MSKNQIPLATAQNVAAKLVTALKGWCERIEIAGSIRREKPVIGDVELVAIPKMGRDLFGEVDPKQDYLATRLLGMESDGMIFRTPVAGEVRGAWGPKYKKFWIKLNDELGEIQVDLFMADRDNWGNIFTIRTGSSDFSAALMTRIKYQTPYRQEDGYLIHQETGARVSVPEESDYFRLAGAEWVPPRLRTGAEAIKAIILD